MESMEKEIENLKELFEAKFKIIETLINANDKNYSQRFDSVTEATKAALASADRAVTKAETAAEKRFEGVNEFRNTLADQQRNLMPRAEVEIIVKALDAKSETNEKRIITLESKGSGISQGIGFVALIIGVVATVTGIIIGFLK